MPSVSPTGTNAQVVYSLPDSAEGHFSIEATTGVIRLEKPLRVGPQAALQLTVRASDLGTPIPLSTLGTVTVSVVGLEDYLPVFLNTEHSVKVPEDALLGMEVLQLATLTRPGSEKTGYRMVSGNEQGRFRLDARTGERALEAALSLVLGNSGFLTYWAYLPHTAPPRPNFLHSTSLQVPGPFCTPGLAYVATSLIPHIPTQHPKQFTLLPVFSFKISAQTQP